METDVKAVIESLDQLREQRDKAREQRDELLRTCGVSLALLQGATARLDVMRLVMLVEVKADG